MSKVKDWVFEGNSYTVGKSLNEFPWEDNNIYPIVWFKGKLYNAFTMPTTSHKLTKVCLYDIHYPNKKPYWTTVDKVYNVIKI